MRTSCRFAMAVHVLTVLAYHKHQNVTSKLLAASVNTHPVVVRLLLLALQAARLIKPRRGASFGSRLARPPSRIHLAQVYRAVELDEPFIMPRGKPNPDCPVGQCIEAELRGIFLSARAALERELGKTSLADVLLRVRACCSSSA